MSYLVNNPFTNSELMAARPRVDNLGKAVSQRSGEWRALRKGGHASTGALSRPAESPTPSIRW